MTNELLAEISLLKEKLERAEKERDAAITEIPKFCFTCVHNHVCSSKCLNCGFGYKNWEWRGIQNDE